MWLFALLAWTGLALFHYISFYFQHVNRGHPFLWLTTLAEFLVNYYVWVPIAAFVVWLGRKIPMSKQKWQRWTLVHVAACLAIATAHVAIITTMLQLAKPEVYVGATNREVYFDILFQLLHLEYLLYFGVLGLSYAIAFYEKRADQQGSPFLSRLAIKQEGKTVLLNTAKIDWLEAADNYVSIHCGAESFLLREKMHTLEKKLDPSRFCRVHRSFIVNVLRIEELRRTGSGEYQVILQGATCLPVSRRRKQAVQDRLEEISLRHNT